jgi:uncharacterized protein (TIGR02118 family)
MKYYTDKHLAMVHRLLDPIGLVRHEVDKGIGTAQPGAQAPYVAIGYLYFKSMEDMQKALSHAGEMMPDIPNFTDVQPQVQISEIL